jgi:hypothetical protein
MDQYYIIYKSNKLNFDITKFCEDKLSKSQIVENVKIYHIVYGKKLYVLKYIKNEEVEITIEILNDTHQFKLYFINIYAIFKCNDNVLCIMENLMNDLGYMIGTFNSKHKFLYLLHCLFAIYHLNNNLNIYHNDIYFKNEIRNVMLYDAYRKYNNKLITLNDLIIPIPGYSIKIIDYGWASHEPGLRTLEYHNMYFLNCKYISEVLLFIYFYFKQLKIDLQNILIEKSNKISNRVTNKKEFDYELIKLIHKKYVKCNT